MKNHTHGKPKRFGRTCSHTGVMDSTAKSSGRPRQRKRTSKKVSPCIEEEKTDEVTNEVTNDDSTASGPLREVEEKVEEKNDPAILEVTESRISHDENIQERPESPVNPYNKFENPRVPATWPGEDTSEPSVVNSVASLECNGLPNAESCGCPKERPNGGCCKEILERKKFYFKIKARVSKAVKRHKIFQIRGDIPTLAKALEQRGWVQKYESVKTRMVPYGSVASLDSKSKGNISNADGTINEKALIFKLLRKKPPDLIWDCRNDFVEWDTALRSHVLLNRLQRSYVYTSKLGMTRVLQDAHWFFEDEVANVKYPRSYNLSREHQAFLTDYRVTAATGLLKWFVSRIERGESFVNVGSDPISISQLEFALARCEDFLADTKSERIDIEVKSTEQTMDDQWNFFLDDCSKVLHKGNGVASPQNEEAGPRFEKCYLAATDTLTKLKALDPQYELNGMRNIWILKPSDLCCGTGISISHNLQDILRRVDSKPKDYFVVQKYIEKPLLVKGTKFDIRLWYLVTCTFPLTIWIFEEALLRFSSKPYTFATYHEAIHICNTAVQQKYAEESRRRKRRIQLGNWDEQTRSALVESIRDQEWDCAKLNEYLKSVGYKGEPFYDEVYPKMSQAIILTMLASQEYMDKRRCSFELYGADFMVMDDLSVWLIEINTNPRMSQPSSKLAQRLYDGVLESLVKVIMDLPLKPTAETGGFRLAYRQSTPMDFQPYLGPCLFVFGKRMTVHEQCHQSVRGKESVGRIGSPWGRQSRACTAPAMLPRRRDPKVVDLIDYLNRGRCTLAR